MGLDFLFYDLIWLMEFLSFCIKYEQGMGWRCSVFLEGIFECRLFEGGYLGRNGR